MRPFLLGGLFIALLSACSVPKTITETAQTLDQGKMRAHVGQSTNIPTAAPAKVVEVITNGVGNVATDTFIVDETFHQVTEALIAQAVDPVASSVDFGLRIGAARNFDIGYKFMGGTHGIDFRYQLVGGRAGTAVQNSGRYNASLGLLGTTKKHKLPSFADNVLGLIFDYGIRRSELTFKLMNSISLGENEEYGHIGFGLSYSHAFVSYGFKPKTAFAVVGALNNVNLLNTFPNHKTNFGGFGGYINFKVGYKYVYFYSAVAFFYTDYGTYNLFADRTYSFSGMTIVPSFGLVFNLYEPN